MTFSQDPISPDPMTQGPMGQDPLITDVSDDTDSQSTKDKAQQGAANVGQSAKEKASEVAATAKDEAASVVDTAKEQTAAVTSEVKQQAEQLLGEVQSQLSEQATSQRDNLAQMLRSVSSELHDMSDRADQRGIGAEIVQRGGELSGQAAEFLEQREPHELLDELRGLARRRPGAFLVGAALAGVVVGRFARGMKGAHSSDSGSSAGGTTRSTTFDRASASEPATAFDADYGRVETPATPAESPMPPSQAGYPGPLDPPEAGGVGTGAMP